MEREQRAAHDAILGVCRGNKQWMMRVAYQARPGCVAEPYLVLHVYETEPCKRFGSKPRVMASGRSWSECAAKLGIQFVAHSEGWPSAG